MKLFKNKILLASIACTLIVFIIFYKLLQKPERLVINNLGQIENKIDQAREIIQGKGFWENQLNQVNKELNYPNEILKIIQIVNKNDEIREQALKFSDEAFKNTNNEVVSKRISSESFLLKKESDRLLRLSERLEQIEFLNMAYKKSLESQSDYQHIKSIIENKISSYK